MHFKLDEWPVRSGRSEFYQVFRMDERPFGFKRDDVPVVQPADEVRSVSHPIRPPERNPLPLDASEKSFLFLPSHDYRERRFRFVHPLACARWPLAIRFFLHRWSFTGH